MGFSMRIKKGPISRASQGVVELILLGVMLLNNLQRLAERRMLFDQIGDQIRYSTRHPAFKLVTVLDAENKGFVTAFDFINQLIIGG